MAQNFNVYLINAGESDLGSMPPIEINSRSTDKKIIYNKNKTRLDVIAGDIYEDETMWKAILWANPEYAMEFDIPDDTVIRVPFPKNDVITEIAQKIYDRKNKA